MRCPEDMGPLENAWHPTDVRLVRRVTTRPKLTDTWVSCDEADDAEIPDEKSCVGCEGWGVECWAWWRPDSVL
jgi:hypothetical protein